MVAFVAIEHLGFLYLEMFLWTKPIGMRVFGNNQEEAEKTKVLAANQGLYNGFLAVGLIWGLLHSSPEISQQVLLFFLACVVVAGVYGGVTAKRSILYIQAVPAVVALIMVLIK